MADEKLVVLQKIVENHYKYSTMSLKNAEDKKDKEMVAFFQGEREAVDRVLTVIKDLLEI